MIEQETKDLEEFKLNLEKTNSIKLCEIVATFRYIGIMKEQALLSMIELASRREKGEVLDYEAKITEIVAGLPKINLDLRSVINNVGRGLKL